MRETVEEIIREFANNPAKAAMEVCTYLDDKRNCPETAGGTMTTR
jgi:hypothetical protein